MARETNTPQRFDSRIERTLEKVATAFRSVRNAEKALAALRRKGFAAKAAPLTRLEDDTTLYLPDLTMKEIEREAIRSSLRRNRGRRTAVINELKISKSTLMLRIATWGMRNEGRDGGNEDLSQ